MAAPSDHSGRSVAAEERKISLLRPRGDVAAALLVLAVCAVLWGITLTIADAPKALARGMQPRLFPQLVIGLIAFLAVLVLLNAGPARAAARTDWRAAGITTLACVLCVALLERAGLVATLLLFAGILPLAWGERRLALVGVYAAVFPILVWLLFRGVLGVHFPGPFAGLLD